MKSETYRCLPAELWNRERHWYKKTKQNNITINPKSLKPIDLLFGSLHDKRHWGMEMCQGNCKIVYNSCMHIFVPEIATKV